MVETFNTKPRLLCLAETYIRELLAIISIAVLLIGMFVAPALLPVRHHTLEERNIALGNGRDMLTVGKNYGIIGFVVSKNGGDDRQYRHVSIAELERAVAPLAPVPWGVDVNDLIEESGAVAFFTAYTPESGYGYFVGPVEILTNHDVELWRIQIKSRAPGLGLDEIVSADPLN